MFYIASTPWWLRILFPSDLTWSFPSKEKVLYLTFDDGPTPGATEFVLDELKKYNAHATFFCIGNNVQQHPDLYQRLFAEGHRVGNHTYDHLNGFHTKDELWLNNIKEAAKWIDSDLFRPPYGKIRSFPAKVLKESNPPFKIIMWSVLSADFDTNISPQKCFENVKKHTKPGSIIVFHDSEKAFSNLRFALPEVLKLFSGEGYRFEVIR
ncbi:polysaccharide deacetylase family protein [Lacibacter sediminis]|uniref:Polysaccharide deacetylase family protein n=1 Tax=Lacibacter sediminis TaxID=2760713 RepID=A0A7G5XI27_9BACT|nr:polysaccharide deacetylase family protein [Lacibacter sediminis]QNA45130.1 polysaccharide deacetylase family protein [Lacibacter sediminis]